MYPPQVTGESRHASPPYGVKTAVESRLVTLERRLPESSGAAFAYTVPVRGRGRSFISQELEASKDAGRDVNDDVGLSCQAPCKPLRAEDGRSVVWSLRYVACCRGVHPF